MIAGPWRIGRAPLPLPLQLVGNACEQRSRADICICNILNQMGLTTAAAIYYYTACMRGRDPFAVVVDSTTPSKIYLYILTFLPTSLSSNLHLAKPNCLLWDCDGRMDATLCPQMSATLSNYLHCLDMKLLLAILSCSLNFLVSRASIACPYAEMLPEYFTERYKPSMGNTAIKTDNVKQVETPESNRLHLLMID